ncbi:molybdenum cofactor biosynthesis protein A [Synechococcus sp. PCC 7335]|uniref:GTP 3',8-cyclase MoaA n=1 Tax=Synechococcus sp. (strain ATCC 29403 / PCC 7335) TaxID=91464 RepID=UPI00017ED1D0|nr:GTP 3',8-cyclase MoaA [Synechococcus sp. PCC 7335]EDX85285.1 molybdenum cofactor biosynthesis protein A [Synechococcus sp. PCC 7335]
MSLPNPPNAIDYLRISLVDRCNFQCVYCMPEGVDLQYALKEHWLSQDEILQLLRGVFIPLGFTRFRLTGGEPLLRPEIVDLVRAITQLPQTEDLAITTNGFLLSKLAQPLYEAGLRRINISLDSLNAQTFEQIIGGKGRSRWHDVWQGIQTAHQVGFSPLKLNVVVIPGINDHEVLELAALSIEQEWHVRFIEFMPIGNDTLFGSKGWIDSESIRLQIRDRWGIETSSVKGNGPADVFQIPGAKGTIGFISQMSECFCDRCNRMRLSADGLLRPCLLNENGQIDLRTRLRNGISLAEIREQVAVLVNQKPEINFKMRESGVTGAYSRTMSQIGG